MAIATQAGLSVVADSMTVAVPDSFGEAERKTLLEQVSFRIEPGEFVCVLGPSGAGKSTLARAILGEREIAAGRLLVGGHDAFHHTDALRGAIGYVPQRDVNPPALPVERALHYASEVRIPAAASASQRQAAIDRAISEVDLDGVRRGTIGSLSGGEMKRATLAAELLAAPGLLVVDEATSSLDPATESRIMTLLSERARAGTTVIAVTHHLDNVDKADKLLILGQGEVVWFGSRVEALGHFGVNRLADVYVAIEDKPRGFWSARWREREAGWRAFGSAGGGCDAGVREPIHHVLLPGTRDRPPRPGGTRHGVAPAAGARGRRADRLLRYSLSESAHADAVPRPRREGRAGGRVG